jgi:hypothetical protein
MASRKIKLNGEDAAILGNVLAAQLAGHHPDDDNYLARLVDLLVLSLVQRIKSRTVVIKDMTMMLSEEHALALAIFLATAPWLGGYSDNILRQVQEQLPPLMKPRPKYATP